MLGCPCQFESSSHFTEQSRCWRSNGRGS